MKVGADALPALQFRAIVTALKSWKTSKLPRKPARAP